VFLDNPYVEMTNNVCERSVKDFVMARKNFLFSYSEKGAEAAGTLMTVIRTARLNQVDPEKYIAYVLSQLGKTRQSDIDSLLPWSESLPKEVRSSKYEVPKAVTDSLKENRYK
ncbi:MAG: transposase domain-containing protein, partial [Bacilli bacterium]|nr:transposase domain-containing protein [Bacilli bacterium]